ncbi:uncharacterized protein F4822DRAFT_126394 [Hypoxylon trugodes]|uniref:uncharacterized protein n=1 Tax=Hypoxylon trugodes TaxID=326681 RepID=UPI0021914721|nr:uncharacterized protein F4822DRAFT_126394 [Hypoxylon trugodes]KAI1392355.1 hypothetical protein F4822DRAFT_126394 [Hypoxylon trugodes]
MSSKRGFGDIMVALRKKSTNFSHEKLEQSPSTSQTSSPNGTNQDYNIHSNQYTEDAISPLSRPPSYTTVVREDEALALKSNGQPDSNIHPDQELESTETRILNLAASYFPPIPSDTVFPPLPKPVLIPRVNPGPQIPFARARVPELANHAITQEDFITFIDNLNIVISPHPAIHVVEITALIIGCIPFQGADGVAAGLGLLAVIATFATTYKRCKKYLELMNENYFHPRKLHVKIIKSKRMMQMFNLEKKNPLVIPLSQDTLDLSSQERCLKYLSQWSCDLSFDDIPAPSPQTNMLRRMAAWEVRRKISEADKKAKSSRKRAWKKHLKGKQLKENSLEKNRIKSLDWILIQNLDEWEASKAEKQAMKEKKKRESSWRTIR